MPQMTDRGADGDNKFIANQGRARVNAYTAGPSGENAADSAVVDSQVRPLTAGGVGDRPILPGGSAPVKQSVLDRPYHGAWLGRIETRRDDPADGAQIARAVKEEGLLLNSRADQYANHGNVGFSGNYPIDWEVEK